MERRLLYTELSFNLLLDKVGQLAYGFICKNDEKSHTYYFPKFTIFAVFVQYAGTFLPQNMGVLGAQRKKFWEKEMATLILTKQCF